MVVDESKTVLKYASMSLASYVTESHPIKRHQEQRDDGMVVRR